MWSGDQAERAQARRVELQGRRKAKAGETMGAAFTQQAQQMYERAERRRDVLGQLVAFVAEARTAARPPRQRELSKREQRRQRDKARKKRRRQLRGNSMKKSRRQVARQQQRAVAAADAAPAVALPTVAYQRPGLSQVRRRSPSRGDSHERRERS